MLWPDGLLVSVFPTLMIYWDLHTDTSISRVYTEWFLKGKISWGPILCGEKQYNAVMPKVRGHTGQPGETNKRQLKRAPLTWTLTTSTTTGELKMLSTLSSTRCRRQIKSVQQPFLLQSLHNCTSANSELSKLGCKLKNINNITQEASLPAK